MTRKLLTLVLILDDKRVLLGMKKRGFGAGRWNGFGGKVQPGETIPEAAVRETREECGVTLTCFEEVGVHTFEFARDRGNYLEVHTFRGDAWEGDPLETEEMRPQWFPIDAIPFDEMWPDDRYWIPIFLEGKKFRTRFLFGEGDQVLEQQIVIVNESPA